MPPGHEPAHVPPCGRMDEPSGLREPCKVLRPLEIAGVAEEVALQVSCHALERLAVAHASAREGHGLEHAVFRADPVKLEAVEPSFCRLSAGCERPRHLVAGYPPVQACRYRRRVDEMDARRVPEPVPEQEELHEHGDRRPCLVRGLQEVLVVRDVADEAQGPREPMERLQVLHVDHKPQEVQGDDLFQGQPSFRAAPSVPVPQEGRKPLVRFGRLHKLVNYAINLIVHGRNPFCFFVVVTES